MFNQTIVVGYTGRSAELRYTPNGKAVADFSVATTRKWDGGEETTWLKVIVWGKLAETCGQYVGKGKQVMCAGRIATSAWIDKSNGEARSSLELTAHRVVFLGVPGTDYPGQEKGSTPGHNPKDFDFPMDEEEEIPF